MRDAQPTSIVSYVYLGKNDGEILTALETFSSKEIYKGNVFGDAVSSNRIPRNVLKLRQSDSCCDGYLCLYNSAIFIGCSGTIVLHNTFLAAPIILEFVLLAGGERIVNSLRNSGFVCMIA